MDLGFTLFRGVYVAVCDWATTHNPAVHASQQADDAARHVAARSGEAST